MKIEFQHPGPVVVQMSFQVRDGTITTVPYRFFARRCVRQPLAAQDLRMHAHDQYLLVVRAVEDPDLAALRQHPGATPEKIVLQFLRAWMLEAEYLAALRVD